MTPSERERRIEAAAIELECCDHDDAHREVVPTWREWAKRALDAADEAVPVVSEAEVEADAERLGGAKVVCPGCGRGLGDVIASILRQRGRFKAQRNEARKRAERAEAIAGDFAEVLARIVGAVRRSDVSIRSGDMRTHVHFEPGDWSTVQATRDALACHPSFSGEEGTER